MFYYFNLHNQLGTLCVHVNILVAYMHANQFEFVVPSTFEKYEITFELSKINGNMELILFIYNDNNLHSGTNLMDV